MGSILALCKATCFNGNELFGFQAVVVLERTLVEPYLEDSFGWLLA